MAPAGEDATGALFPAVEGLSLDLVEDVALVLARRADCCLGGMSVASGSKSSAHTPLGLGIRQLSSKRESEADLLSNNV